MLSHSALLHYSSPTRPSTSLPAFRVSLNSDVMHETREYQLARGQPLQRLLEPGVQLDYHEEGCVLQTFVPAAAEACSGPSLSARVRLASLRCAPDWPAGVLSRPHCRVASRPANLTLATRRPRRRSW